MSRYEVKLVGMAGDLPRIRSEIHMLPACLRPLHPSRCVQSIYFDTYDSRALVENLAGISQRRKLRLRWYGEFTDRVQANLECKQRKNHLGDKNIFRLDSVIEVAGISRRSFTAAVAAAAPPAARLLLQGYEPVQWIRYWRDYLGSSDGQLRITIDRDITAFEQRFGSRIQCHKRTPLPAIVVVEIKADEADGEKVADWLQNFPLRPSKCSKFVLAHQPGSAVTASNL